MTQYHRNTNEYDKRHLSNILHLLVAVLNPAQKGEKAEQLITILYLIIYVWVHQFDNTGHNPTLSGQTEVVPICRI